MDQSIRQFLKESVEMELNIGDLYQLFSVKFPSDHGFWWGISMEEISHAALIESIDDVFMTESLPPVGTIDERTVDLKNMNLKLMELIENCKLLPTTRLDSFKYGIGVENSIGEFHYQHFMTTEPDSQMAEIFQRLNGEDINHAKRIARYMENNYLR